MSAIVNTRRVPLRRSLKVKITVLFLIGFVLVVLPVNVTVYEKLKASLIASNYAQLAAEADKLFSQVKLDPLIVPLPQAGFVMQLQIIDEPYSKVLFASPGFTTLESQVLWLDEVDIDTLSIVNLRRQVAASGGQLVLSLARSNLMLAVQLQEFKLYLFYITGVLIVLALALVFGITGYMLQPLQNIIAKAENINAAESIDRLPIPKAGDETTQLSTTLNTMLERIETAMNNQLKFFDAATHELKTPLAVMRTQLSLARADSTHISANFLHDTLHEVARLERTISDFLLMSQLKSKTLVTRMELVDVDELTYKTAAELNPMLLAKQCTLDVQLSGTVFSVHADADKVQTILTNLLENAIAYSPAGRVITIKLQNNAGSICLLFSNTALQAVENFQVLGKQRYLQPKAARGLGLGLWITQQIMELHGGSLNLRQDKGIFMAELAFPSATPTKGQVYKSA